MSLGRDQILKAKLATRVVETVDGEIRIQALSVMRRVELSEAYVVNAQAIEDYSRDQALPEDERAGLPKVEAFDFDLLTIIFSVVDDDGAWLFSLEDYPEFSQLSFTMISALGAAVNALNTIPDVASKKKRSA